MEWSFILAAVRRRIGLVVVCAVVFAIPGLIRVVTAEPTYEAAAVISVATPTAGAGSASAAYAPDRFVVGQLSVVTSNDTLSAAADTLGGDWTAAGIGAMVAAEQEPETDLIRVLVTAGDPEAAANVANAVARAYIANSTTSIIEARQPEIDALNAKLDALATDLANINEAISEIMKPAIETAVASTNGVLPSEQMLAPNEVQRRDSIQAEYARVLSARSDIELGLSNQAPSILVEEASAPSTPKRDLGQFIVIAGAIFGALAGTAVALVLAQLSSKVVDEQSAEVVLGVPLVASIPRSRNLAQPIAALERPQPDLNEAIERISVRAEAMASPNIDEALTIAVVGTQPGSATTTLTLSLARRFGQAGYDVVVVDGDLRTQTLSELFKANRRGGIAALLRSTNRNPQKNQQYFTSTTEKNVSLLGIGNIDRRSALRRDALGPILEVARESGQIVLYDGGSLTSSSLSLFATKAADVVVLAVPIADQDQQELREVAAMLPEDRSRVLPVATAPQRRRSKAGASPVNTPDERAERTERTTRPERPAPASKPTERQRPVDEAADAEPEATSTPASSEKPDETATAGTAGTSNTGSRQANSSGNRQNRSKNSRSSRNRQQQRPKPQPAERDRDEVDLRDDGTETDAGEDATQEKA